MRLSWHHGFLDPRDGTVDVEPSRVAIAEAIGRVLPHLAPIPVDRVSFVPQGDGRRTQVNLHMFGPFGVLER
jgi:hypothetical protein